MKRLACTAAQLLAVGVLATGCGGSSDSSAQASDSSAQAAEQVVVKRPFQAEPRGSVIYLGLGLSSCGLDPPSISRVEVLQRRPRIVIAVYVRYVRDTTSGADCPEEQAVLSDTVKLAHPVGTRSIYDAFRKPPVKRWPHS